MSSSKRKREEFDDSDENEPAYGKQILPVANLPNGFNDEPMDGMQYLFTVRRDARQLPDIVSVPNPYETADAPVVESSDQQRFSVSSCLPSEEWRETFELRFQNFRKNFNQPTIHVGPASEPTRRLMPDKKDRDLWWAFLLGKSESQWTPANVSKGKSKRQLPQGMRAWPDEPPQNNADTIHTSWHNNDEGEVEQVLRVDPAESLPSPVGTPVPLEYLEELSQPSSGPMITPVSSKETTSPREPTTALLKLIDERMALHLLMYFAHWIQLHLKSPKSSDYVPLETHARWMFALLSRIDDYISADDMNLLRNLARACLGLLLELRREQKSPSSTALPLGPESKMGETSCWIIITVVAEIWKQKDIWMDAQDMLIQMQV